jgi:hypothetical protein
MRLGRARGSSGCYAGCRSLSPDLEVIEQLLGRYGYRRHGAVEGLGVMTGRRTEPADLADVLESGGANVGVSHVLGIRLTKGLDAAAHSYRRYARNGGRCDGWCLMARPGVALGSQAHQFGTHAARVRNSHRPVFAIRCIIVIRDRICSALACASWGPPQLRLSSAWIAPCGCPVR